jgi:hypothetical protein
MMLEEMQPRKLRLDRGEIGLAADACYFCRTLHQQRHGAMLVGLDRFEAPENFGARISFGHDPEFWRFVPQGRQVGGEAGLVGAGLSGKRLG